MSMYEYEKVSAQRAVDLISELSNNNSMLIREAEKSIDELRDEVDRMKATLQNERECYSAVISQKEAQIRRLNSHLLAANDMIAKYQKVFPVELLTEGGQK